MSLKNKIIMVIGISVAIFGCSESKKLAKAKKVFDDHSLEASEYCYLKFPVAASVEYREGKVIRDTFYSADNLKLDTLYLQSDGTETIKYITQTKYKTIVKRQVDTVFKSVENTAKIKAFQERFENSLAVEKKQDELIKVQAGTINQRTKWLWWLLLVILLQSIYILRKPLIKLFL